MVYTARQNAAMPSPPSSPMSVSIEKPGSMPAPPPPAGGGDFTASTTFRIMLLAAMVLQYSSVVIVGRYTRTSTKEEDMFVISHFILVTECCKFLGSCILEAISSGNFFKSVYENVVQKPTDALKVSVPALLYLLQNSLLFVALSNLSAPFLQAISQFKVFTTAIVSVIMLGRRYSLQQWICLLTLGAGVAIVVLGESGALRPSNGEDEGAEAAVVEEVVDEDVPQQSFIKGISAVVLSCFTSAFACVYFEKVVKGGGGNKKPVSLWLRNMQLAFFSVTIAFMQSMQQEMQAQKKALEEVGGDESLLKVDSKPYLHGFTRWVWVLVLLQAGGGLLIGAIIKYADNVLKGIATGVAVAVSTAMSMVVFNTPLTPEFVIGAIVILTSVYFFSAGPPKKTDNAPPKVDYAQTKPLLGSSPIEQYALILDVWCEATHSGYDFNGEDRKCIDGP